MKGRKSEEYRMKSGGEGEGENDRMKERKSNNALPTNDVARHG